MPDTVTCRCYAVRRLNPFRGVTQVVQLPASRALSIDGVRWELQVRAVRPDDMWGAASRGPATHQYLRFGVWSLGLGLQQVPANPLLNIDDMQAKAEQLLSTLEEKIGELPFPLADRHEFWLLDGRQRLPLALLASGLRQPEHPLSLAWQAAGCEDPGFSHGGQEAAPSPVPSAKPRRPGAWDALTRQVRAAAGEPVGQWFERDEDGYGWGGETTLDPGLGGRRLGPVQFPELLLRRGWESPRAAERVTGYLAQCSPALLTLPTLSANTRNWLEGEARRHATGVARFWRLYPPEVDRALIDAARVETRIRQAR